MTTSRPVESAGIPGPLLNRLVDTAVQAAVRAGNIQQRAFGNGQNVSYRLPRDLKLEVDRECEAVVVDTIQSRFPGHRILGEEGGEIAGNDDFLWIVDPLDGTVNFFHGIPHFCACVACCRLPAGEPVPVDGRKLLESGLVGVVAAPITGEHYIGVRGQGAMLNGRPLCCSTAEHLKETIVALSFGKSDAAIAAMARTAEKIALNARKVRSWGSAGLDIVQVACGRLGGVVYRGIHLWDVAAAGIILAEAGGRLTAGLQPGGTWNLVAAAPGVHEELRRIEQSG